MMARATQEVGHPEPCHEAFVAGVYRDGEFSDIWTDVTRCAWGTFVAYVPACTCGWVGSRCPVSPEGFVASQRAYAREHPAKPPGVPRPRSGQPDHLNRGRTSVDR
jgi:hypothetical protein